jgi:hypothetical protein
MNEDQKWYRLKQDLYALGKLDSRGYVTAVELKDATTLVHKAGDVYLLDPSGEYLSGPMGDYSVGIGGAKGEPDLWERVETAPNMAEREHRRAGAIYSAKAPNGLAIVGTSDTAPMVCLASQFQLNGNFLLEALYEDQTDVDWNNQTVQTLHDEKLYVDEQGNRWRENQLVLAEVIEESDAPHHTLVGADYRPITPVVTEPTTYAGAAETEGGSVD